MWAWVPVAIGGAVIAEGIRIGWEAYSSRIRGRPRGVRIWVTYHPVYNSVIINVLNRGKADVEVSRVITQFQDRRRYRQLLGIFARYAPLEIPFMTAMRDERIGSRGNVILPGGSGMFTAGHRNLALAAPKAKWMAATVYFGDKHLSARINLAFLRKQFAKPFPKYQPAPDEALVKTTEMYQFVPSFPPVWEPATKIVKRTESKENVDLSESR